MHKNDVATIQITGMTHDGMGVGRADGYVLFVPLTAVGDTAQVKVVKAGKDYGYGRLEQLIAPSPDRVQPACPVFAQCGGCSYQHITYEAELVVKQRQVEAALRKSGVFPASLRPIVGAPSAVGYRNKILLPVGEKNGRVVTGFYRPRSHDIVPNERCLLQPEQAQAAAGALCAHMAETGISPYDEARHEGLVRGLFVRVGQATGQVMAVVVINGETLPQAEQLARRMRGSVPGLVSLQLNHNTQRTNVVLGDRYTPVFGQDAVEDVLLGVRYRVSAASFYQVNRDQCEALYSCAAELAALSGETKLLDLYCGIGSIGLSMAVRCKEVVGVELVQQAVDDAAACAALNGVKNARFLCADASQAARELRLEGFSPDVVVLDPPRKGCDAELLETVAGMSPKRIVYVSCNPATLARDMALLGGMGYAPQVVAPYDMFPRTSHVECVALLTRTDA